MGLKVAFHLSLHKNHAQALSKNVSISLEPSAEAAALASIICKAISVSLVDFLCNAANVFLLQLYTGGCGRYKGRYQYYRYR